MDQVRFGIIGAGSMGSIHIGHFPQIANAQLTAICDVDPKRLEAARAKTDARQFSRAEDLLDSGLVDAVLVATPHYDHPPIAIAAFERGIHVLSEKPVAVTVGAARKLNDAYAKHASKVKFAVMFQQRTRPVYKKLRDLVTSGELGEISRITWIVTDWFRSWTYYASGGWRATWAGEGGGVLLNQCPHNLDLLHWIVGGLVPNRITAVASIAKTHPIEVEDEVSAIMEYPNGAIGHFITTTGELPGTNRLEIVGDRGAIVATGGKLHFRRIRGSADDLLRNSPESFPSPETWDIDIPFKTAPEGHRIVTDNFVKAILKNDPLIAPGTEGVKGLEIGNAMLMAGLTRTPVALPMDAAAYDEFLSDLTRKYGGKKQLGTKEAQADMAASFR
jgi:predicted dehydrogenase